MPRRESPLAGGDSRLLRFAGDLRLLREKAGQPTYRALAASAHCSAAALSEAASGRKLPSLQITLAYVRGCEGDVAEWEQRWHELAGALAAPPVQDDVEAPYAGLATFQEKDAERFFGREQLVRDIEAKLRSRRFLGVFGASGAGKSSVLRAGLLPRLEHALVFTPGGEPVEELAVQLAAMLDRPVGSLREELIADARALYRTARRPGEEDPELVVVVDQFEELFTHCRDEVERARFLDLLVTAAEAPSSRCRVLIGVRADFYVHCAGHARLVDVLRDAQITVGPMTAAELRSAIVQPALRVGCAVEGSLLATLIAQADGDVGALPLLSHVLLETWKRRRGTTLTIAGYHAAGGITGALARTADAMYGNFDDEQRRTVRPLLVRLTTAGVGSLDVKRRVPVTELDLTPASRFVVDRLIDARLLTRDRDTLELTHEALIQGWPRLRDWLADDREGLRIHRRLIDAARIWDSLDRDPGALYRGSSLEAGREWAGRSGSAVNALEREFLGASEAAAGRELAMARKHALRARQLTAVLCVLLLCAATAIILVLRAEAATSEQRNNALSEVAAGKAAGLRAVDPALAAQLSVAAFRFAPSDEAKNALLNSVPVPTGGRLTGHRGHVNAVALSPDSRLGATASHDGTVMLWDTTGRPRATVLATLNGHNDNVNHVAFSPDSRLLATAGWDGTARLWAVGDPRRVVQLAVLRTHHDDVNFASFSADGTLLVTTSTDGTAKLWNVTRPDVPIELTTLAAGHGGVVSAAFTDDQRLVATANWDGTTALWDVADPRRPSPPAFLYGHRGAVVWVAFGPTGRLLATGSQDRTARLWDVSSPSAARERAVLTGHDGTVRSVAFNADGTVATASEDQTVRLWRTDGAVPKTFAVLRGHSAPVVAATFSRDGRILMTGSDDDSALLWSIPAVPVERMSPDEAAALVCERSASELTPDAWNRFLPAVPYQPPCDDR
jgi:hypothetical protein